MTTSTTVGEIMAALPQSEQDYILGVLDDDLNPEDKVKLLRSMLNKYGKELEALGVVPDYFAYLLVYLVLPSMTGERSFSA